MKVMRFLMDLCLFIVFFKRSIAQKISLNSKNLGNLRKDVGNIIYIQVKGTVKCKNSKTKLDRSSLIKKFFKQDNKFVIILFVHMYL